MSDPMEASEDTGILTRSIFPSPGAGWLGVVAARAGVGKSTCLVRIALGELVRGRQVLHVSLDNPVGDVRAAHDTKLDALHHLEPRVTTAALRFKVERRRVIHSFLRGSFSPGKLDEALGFLAEHADFRPATIILDGYRFDRTSLAEVEALAQVARRSEAELWTSALVQRDEFAGSMRELPAPLMHFNDLLRVVVDLEPRGDEIYVYLLKEGDRVERVRLPVRLDPSTMLLVHDQQLSDEGL